MLESDALAKMIAPGTPRPSKWRGGVIQILVTSSCDLSCFSCTQGSNLRRKPWFMTPEQFEGAVLSLKGYWGVYGVFGGNPCVSPHFEEYCKILQRLVPREQRGLWSNNPLGKGRICRETFNPAVSNINVHLSKEAYDEWRRDWPECHPVGLHDDSRHAPVHLAMKDLDILPAHPGQDEVYLTKMLNTEENRWKLISECDINRYWSAMIGVFRGELRAWFCEVAGAQAILHQEEEDYPDTGIRIPVKFDSQKYADGEGNWVRWWQLPMSGFAAQARKHCHECAVPLRGYGELAQSTDPAAAEQTSLTHLGVVRPKRPNREVEVVTRLQQLGIGLIKTVTKYLQNSKV